MTNQEIATKIKAQIEAGENPEDLRRGLYQSLLNSADAAGALDLHEYAGRHTKEIMDLATT